MFFSQGSILISYYGCVSTPWNQTYDIACWYMGHEWRDASYSKREYPPAMWHPHTYHIFPRVFHVIPMGELPVPSFASQRNPGVSVPPEASKVPEVCITGMKKKHSLARNSPFHWIGSRWYQMVDVQFDRMDYWRWVPNPLNHPEWVYQNVPKLYI